MALRSTVKRAKKTGICKTSLSLDSLVEAARRQSGLSVLGSDIDDAVKAAQAALPAWRARTAKERANILRRWFDLMMANQRDLALIIACVHCNRLSSTITRWTKVLIFPCLVVSIDWHRSLERIGSVFR